MLVDRSAGATRFEVPTVSLLELSFPTYATSARDDILDNEHRFVRSERETTAQYERVVFFLCENIAGLRLACDFLSDDQTAHCRRKHRGELQFVRGDLRQQQLGEAFDRIHPLTDLRALEVMAAVESRSEDEVPPQQSAGARENFENFGLRGEIGR